MEFPMSFDSIQNKFPPWFDVLGQFRHSSRIFLQSVTCTLQTRAGIDDVIWYGTLFVSKFDPQMCNTMISMRSYTVFGHAILLSSIY